MIRRITVLVLLALYSAVAIGVPLHYHYCEGELQHISIFAPKECESHDDTHEKIAEPLTCCQGNLPTHCGEAVTIPDCCDDETELLQLDETVTAIVFLQGHYTDAIVACEFAELPAVQQKEDAPGDLVQVLRPKPILPYLEHCSLIFYG